MSIATIIRINLPYGYTSIVPLSPPFVRKGTKVGIHVRSYNTFAIGLKGTSNFAYS